MLRNKDKAAMTPPMGWNSWDCWAATATEDLLVQNAAYMAQHLKPFGWEYIVCDIQWSEPQAGTGPREYRNFAHLTLDEYGRQIPAVNRFPSSAGGRGFAPLAGKIHAMGLKFGIHIMRGIPRQAVHAHLPVLGGNCTADEVANPFSISRWNGDMYGLYADRPGAQAYYNSIFQLYADWGVDYVKVDDICNTNMYPTQPYSAEKEIEMIRRAIDNSGRQMVLSLSPGPAVIEKAWHLEKNANMWRITDDFWDDWDLLKAMFERCEVWQKHVSAGCWPDCDMLPLGRIGIGFHQDRRTRFTRAEQVTMMTLWCIFRSPLMMGGNLPDCDEWTLSLLTNAEVMHLLGHTENVCQLARDEEHVVWTSTEDTGTSRYLALFNLSDTAAEVSSPLSEISLAQADVRDLWAHRDLGTIKDTVSAALPPHGAALYQLTGLQTIE
ncbi:MAG: glycoside hydrolase family 27 protein [Oscillospiraceae bacterium]|jgi:hypothetical protein|nr:glycoside hydrolase family 27 protein [Oscillospiraceae bacterium]